TARRALDTRSPLPAPRHRVGPQRHQQIGDGLCEESDGGRGMMKAIAAAIAVIAFVEPLQAQEGVSGYECDSNHAYHLEKDDLKKLPEPNLRTMYKDLAKKGNPTATAVYYFAVDRATGQMKGYLTSEGGRAVVVDDAKVSGQSYKAIYFSDPGPFVHARYLAILVFESGPNKPFLLVDTATVVT